MSQPWQLRALSYYDQIGEIRFASQFYAKLLSKVRYYPARQLENGQTEPITSGDPVEFLHRIQDPGGGRSRLLYDYGRMMFVTGEGVLFGDNLETEGERWRFLWKDEVKPLDDNSSLWQRVRYDKTPFNPPEIGQAYRFWTPHPRHSDMPDSPLHSVMDIAEELLILTAAVRATAVTRLTNGVWLMPSEISPNPYGPPDSSGDSGEYIGDEDPETNPFLDDWIEHTEAQIENPGSSEARVPFLLEGPYEYLDRVRWVQTHDPQTDYMERELRKEAVHRLALGMDFPPEFLLGMTDANHWCQDARTEILARGRGWIRHDELNVGDIVLTLDHETGRSEWQPVESIYRADVEREVMYAMHSHSHSSLSTPEHRWPIVKTGYKVAGSRRRWTTSADGFSASDRVPVAAWLNEDKEEVYVDDFVRLAVAYTADGTNIEHGNIRIAKFAEHEIEEIRRILTTLYGATGFREHTHPTRTAQGTAFVLRQAEARQLLAICVEQRAIALTFVDELSARQRLILLDSCAEIGDGVSINGATTLYQAEPDRLDAFAYAAHLSGFKVTYGRRNQQTGFGTEPLSWVRWSCSRDTFVPASCKQTLEAYTGTVWCPVTKNQTWLARRDGHAYFTGNTARQVVYDMWRSYGAPVAERFGDDLADAYLRPALAETGYPNWQEVVVAYDDSQVVIAPDRTEDADKALDRAAIGWEGYRELKGIPESMAPTEDEFEMLVAMKLRQPVEIDDGELLIPQRGPVAQQNGTDPQDGPPSPTGGREVSRQEVRTASARIYGAAEMALHRCRELAGLRIRHKCSDCAEGEPLSVVASALGIAAVQDPMKLVQGGADGLRSLLVEWGWEEAQSTSLCQQLEVYAARTLFQPTCPDLPSGFVAAIERAREVSDALGS
jgi:hypothetical protein